MVGSCVLVFIFYCVCFAPYVGIVCCYDEDPSVRVCFVVTPSTSGISEVGLLLKSTTLFFFYY